MKFLLLIFSLLCLTLSASPARVESVVVKTRSPQNQTTTVYYRVPKDYSPNGRESARVLIIFGGRNTTGEKEASGQLGFGQWADEHGIFLVCPGFKNDTYWEPQEWSGRALMKALSEIKKKYNICTTKMLYYGYSAGSQASNLFPAWKPDATRAWVSHACGVFHEPTQKMRGVPGLVTCGDADQARYILTRRFVEESRKRGVEILWKSFPNHPHDVPPDSLKLARAFLTYFHEMYREDLSFQSGIAMRRTPKFIGDDQECVYYPADSPKAKNIFPEDRVFLPTLELADAWGKPSR